MTLKYEKKTNFNLISEVTPMKNAPFQNPVKEKHG